MLIFLILSFLLRFLASDLPIEKTLPCQLGFDVHSEYSYLQFS